MIGSIDPLLTGIGDWPFLVTLVTHVSLVTRLSMVGHPLQPGHLAKLGVEGYYVTGSLCMILHFA